MRSWTVLPVCVLFLSAGHARAQEDSEGAVLDRGDRVVIYSPHYDTPLPRWGGLSCPSGPLHLYGFESDEADEIPQLRVRAFLFDPTLTREVVLPADGAGRRALEPARPMIRLTHRIESGQEVELPLNDLWAAIADIEGLATLRVPAGVYRLRAELVGVHDDEGIIRVREARSDSIHAYLLPGAICDR